MAAEDVTALRRFYELVGASMAEMDANSAAPADITAALERVGSSRSSRPGTRPWRAGGSSRRRSLTLATCC